MASGVLVHEIAQRQTGAVGAQPEIGGMAEAQHAGEPQQQVQPHRGQAEHQHAPGERRIAAEQRKPVAAPRSEAAQMTTSMAQRGTAG